jgi:hypothetical protein
MNEKKRKKAQKVITHNLWKARVYKVPQNNVMTLANIVFAFFLFFKLNLYICKIG